MVLFRCLRQEISEPSTITLKQLYPSRWSINPPKVYVDSLAQLLKECEALHGHMCAGQVLGARMAMLGCELVKIDEPRGRDQKKLIVWVEIDRCMADAVSAVTGVR